MWGKNLWMSILLVALPSLLLSELSETEFIPICVEVRDQFNPAAAFDGANFLVVWQDRRSPELYFDIYGQFVKPTGELIDINFRISEITGYHHCHPAVAFGKNYYLVVWQEYIPSEERYKIYGQLLTQSGQCVLPHDICIASSTEGGLHEPVVAFDGTNFLVVWEDWSNGMLKSDIYCTLVSEDGEVGTPHPISTALNAQRGVNVAFGGGVYLVVWFDYRDFDYISENTSKIYGRLVSPSTGEPMGPEILIGKGDYEQLYPDVAYDNVNDRFLVVWSEINKIYGQLVSTNGALVENKKIIYEGTEPEERHCNPAVEFDGTHYLVVWQGWHGIPDMGEWQPFYIWKRKLKPDGTPPESESAEWVCWLHHGDYWVTKRSPEIAFGANKYLVVWEDYDRGTSYSEEKQWEWDIWGRIINP